jgi:hypothetical protein
MLKLNLSEILILFNNSVIIYLLCITIELNACLTTLIEKLLDVQHIYTTISGKRHNIESVYHK